MIDDIRPDNVLPAALMKITSKRSSQRLTLGLGTRAASLAMKSIGSKIQFLLYCQTLPATASQLQLLPLDYK